MPINVSFFQLTDEVIEDSLRHLFFIESAQLLGNLGKVTLQSNIFQRIHVKQLDVLAAIISQLLPCLLDSEQALLEWLHLIALPGVDVLDQILNQRRMFYNLFQSPVHRFFDIFRGYTVEVTGSRTIIVPAPPSSLTLLT